MVYQLFIIKLIFYCLLSYYNWYFYQKSYYNWSFHYIVIFLIIKKMIVFSDFKKWIAVSQYSISQTVPQIIYPQYPIWPCPYHGRTKWSSDLSRWQILVRWCNRVTRVVPIFCMFCKEKLPRTAQDCKSTPNKTLYFFIKINKTLYITCGQFFSYFFLGQKKKKKFLEPWKFIHVEGFILVFFIILFPSNHFDVNKI